MPATYSAAERRQIWRRLLPPAVHPIAQFAEKLASFGPYPAKMLEMRGCLSGFSFFPGGAGLREASPGKTLPAFPFDGVMVVGHVFYGSAGFEEQLANGWTDDQYNTGQFLLAWLDDAGINARDCFFTNFFVGVMDVGRNTGPCPGARDRDFVGRCLSFLEFQIRLQRPRLVLTLGAEIPSRFARLGMCAGLQPWSSKYSLTAIDQAGVALLPRVTHDGFAFAAACLTHPGYGEANLGRRRYGNLTGKEAHAALLRDARLAANRLR